MVGLEIGQKLKVIGLPVWDLDQESLALEVGMGEEKVPAAIRKK